ncbi:NAD(P)-dependent oxidoreductase [Paenibacillus montanisoli]|uniref:Dehydrogenase n=1 Tax=Paenibacillus montanisoli TaxID=2081970 RepID=A0A328UAG5_9BACL|nr:NAD(P)-dependent oxidoreductase [Paenibacillus montanisoli]RAP77925.1 dehydrogenase [Paenibacillus montanisoli]
MRTFKVGLSRDFLNAEGRNAFGEEGIETLQSHAHLEYGYFDEHRDPVGADQIAPWNGIISLTPKYTAETLKGADDLLVLARFGVGYDNVDVEACTEADVALTITPNGVRKPVAYSIMTHMLALAHQYPVKTRLVKENRWNDRINYPGKRITGQTLGSIGLGNIAREMFHMTAGFEMRRLAYDPYIDPKIAKDIGVELVSLEELFERSDYIAVNCFLSKETYHLVSDALLGLMKPTAYIINTARGGIIDEAALIRALEGGKLAGAALDVFEEEPFVADSPLKHMDNVILTPHSLCWTDELYQGMWADSIASVSSFAKRLPTSNVVNKEVLQKNSFLNKMKRLCYE